MPSTDSIEILLVEDNPGDVQLIKEAFSETCIDARFHVVTDGKAALEFLHDRRAEDPAACPNLGILDLNLPGMNGDTVLERLKDDPELCTLPILVLTGSSTEEDVIACYERGANAYLTKPDDIDEFVKMARAIEEFWIGKARLPPIPS